MMNKNNKIYIAGHNGMVGSSIVRRFKKLGYDNLVVRSSSELDLTDAVAVRGFFESEKPDVVILAAARVGGIQANIDHPAEFLYENMMIQNNVIHQSYIHNVKNFCFLGSSCIYPRECQQPIKEEYLLTGPLEPTNEGYALAKISGLKMVEYYRQHYEFNGISVMPCNLYGTNDNYNLKHSHVLSSLVRRMVDAVDNGDDRVIIWGSGIARREFMHVDDASRIIIELLQKDSKCNLINIGWGLDISIKDLAYKIADYAGFKGAIEWDEAMPDGMLLKCMDVSRMEDLEVYPEISLEDGIVKTINEYIDIKENKSKQ
jgi:GDP-L-fucose synthase